MELHKKFNKKVEFSQHALLRGKQYGYTEEELQEIMYTAERMRKAKSKPFERIYKTGSMKFFTHNYSDRIVVKTVWDDLLMRREF